MAEITIEIRIDESGSTTVSPNPATVEDGDTVRWHVAANEHSGGAISVKLPASSESPFGNADELLQAGVEQPRRCNVLEPATAPARWPDEAESYEYKVEFSGSPMISTARGRLLRRREPAVAIDERIDDIQEIYAADGSPGVGGTDLVRFRKVYPLKWWQRLWSCCHWPRRYDCGSRRCTCCCCCASPRADPDTESTPSILLSLGYLAIGGQFYLLITRQGQRCQFVVDWAAAGGGGQLTVDLDVQEPGASGFRRLATGFGPVDQYVYTGARSTYIFRARVTDSQGISSFDTLTVTCP